MSDYTPTTKNVRDAYAYQDDGRECNPALPTPAQYAAEFDHWLAQHEAEIVKATEERIIALLADPFWHGITFPDIHDKDCPMCYTIALIKGETK